MSLIMITILAGCGTDKERMEVTASVVGRQMRQVEKVRKVKTE